MILLIDNYDSFSYNLYQMVGYLAQNLAGEYVKVVRNDELDTSSIEELNPAGIILSPGPGRPEDAGVCIDVVKELGGKIPILGVCLGHQSICQALGGKVTYAKHLMHGKQSKAELDPENILFRGIGPSCMVGRYHSLAADPGTLPECLKVTAWTQDGEIMAVSHKEKDIHGLQFHPESILTPEGSVMLENWVRHLQEDAGQRG